MRLPYKIGDWFTVTDDQGVAGTGVVLAMNGRGVVAGDFYCSSEPAPSPSDANQIGNPALTMRFGDLAILEGRWPLHPTAGKKILLDRELEFIRENMFGERFYTRYDRRLGLDFERKLRPDEFPDLPLDGVYGSTLAEWTLRRRCSI